MSAGSACPRALGCAAAIMAGAMAAQGQITITGADMFNQVGQYYLAYANDPNSTNTVDVSGMLGTAGSVTQAWNFTTGPQDVTNRYDYLAASNTPYGADFVATGAQMAQQLTIEGATNGLEWFYFTQDPVKGQIDYGLHEPSPGPVLMDWVFTSPLQDFPASIHYGDSWSGATVFYTTYSRVPVQITLTSTDTVDAFGYVTLPNNGSGLPAGP